MAANSTLAEKIKFSPINNSSCPLVFSERSYVTVTTENTYVSMNACVTSFPFAGLPGRK